MNNIGIGKFLRHKRTEKGLTQAQLAQQFGVTYQAVSRWETGDSIPDIETLVMIADYYNITVDDILLRNTTTQQSNLVDTDNKFTPVWYMKLLFAIFIFSHILGFGLGLAFASLSGAIWQILAILSFVLFVAGAHFSFNVYFFAMSDKTQEEVQWYQNTYKTFLLLVLLTMSIINLLSTLYGVAYWFIIVFLIYVLVSCLSWIVESKYVEHVPFIQWYFNKYKKMKIVLLVIVLLLFILPINSTFGGFTRYIINLILIVLALL